MEILRLHHGQISIPKGAEEKAREFYCTVLGLKEIEKPNALKGRGGFWLELGEIQIHFGADDNASGVSVVLELAHALSSAKSKRDFKKDLYFAVWSGEEIGLLGSKAWAKEWSTKNGNLSQTFAATLNFDMVGRLKNKLIVQIRRKVFALRSAPK